MRLSKLMACEASTLVFLKGRKLVFSTTGRFLRGKEPIGMLLRAMLKRESGDTKINLPLELRQQAKLSSLSQESLRRLFLTCESLFRSITVSKRHWTESDRCERNRKRRRENSASRSPIHSAITYTTYLGVCNRMAEFQLQAWLQSF